MPSNVVRVEATPRLGEGMRDVRGNSVKRQLQADHGIEISEVRSIVGFLIDSEITCLLYTSPSPRDVEESRMPSSA